MKIAIPTRSKVVDDHFGHCEYYTIYSIGEGNSINDEEFYEAPKGCGCKSNISTILKEKGVDVMLAGNMGQGAVNKITAEGIQVIRGCSGSVKEVANAYLKGFVIDSGLTCSHHEEGHTCNH